MCIKASSRIDCLRPPPPLPLLLPSPPPIEVSRVDEEDGSWDGDDIPLAVAVVDDDVSATKKTDPANAARNTLAHVQRTPSSPSPYNAMFRCRRRRRDKYVTNVMSDASKNDKPTHFLTSMVIANSRMRVIMK